jgi:hypothetical protein
VITVVADPILFTLSATLDILFISNICVLTSRNAPFSIKMTIDNIQRVVCFNNKRCIPSDSSSFLVSVLDLNIIIVNKHNRKRVYFPE